MIELVTKKRKKKSNIESVKEMQTTTPVQQNESTETHFEL